MKDFIVEEPQKYVGKCPNGHDTTVEEVVEGKCATCGVEIGWDESDHDLGED